MNTTMLRKSFLFISLCIMLSLLLTACGGVQAQDKTYTVGVICDHVAVEKSFDGFKEGLVELGYVEGENVTYIYNGPMPDPQAGEREVESLLA